MKSHFACGHCRTINRFTSYSARYWREQGKAASQRCVNCGATHGCRNYEAEVISPRMCPINTVGRVSPFYPPEYRPIDLGLYECYFESDDFLRLFLWWNGSYFQISKTDARRVDVRTMQKWRGVWA